MILIFLIISFSLVADETYIIQEGDTLYSLSKKYNVDFNDIIKINNIIDSTSINVGTIIQIPKQEIISNQNVYKVVEGDTLFGISKKFKLTLSQLMEYNNLKEGDIISLGQSLNLGLTSQSLVVNIPKAVDKDVLSVIDSLPYWPIAGDISKYTGRIQGVEIKGSSGDYIQAVSNGRVIWYDSYKGIGKVVLIEGDNGYDYLYGTKENLNVSMGVHVNAGERLGRLKDNNTSIIFSVFKNGKPLTDISKAPR